jgi:hypothetical protein
MPSLYRQITKIVASENFHTQGRIPAPACSSLAANRQSLYTKELNRYAETNSHATCHERSGREPQTAIRRPSNPGLESPYPIEQAGRLLRDSLKSPTTFSTNLEDTPDVSSHGSYYDPKPTPSHIHPRHDKGKSPLHKDQFNDDDPSVTALGCNLLYK